MAQRYETYKDSGVQWLGKIPSHWNVFPFKSNFSLGKGLNITKANLTESGVKVISYGQIHSKLNKCTNIEESLFRFVSHEYISSNPQCLLDQEDFIFADTSEDVEGSGNFVRKNDSQTTFAGYHTIIGRNKIKNNGAFLAYLLQSPIWKQQIWIQVHGVKVYSISRTILNSTKLIIPPYQEQESIVAFLDEKCGKIDEWVEKKLKEVELLGEMKQRIIADAVTRGLNPNVTMKETSNPYLSQIPETWMAIKMKYLFKERSEKNHPNEPMLSATQNEGVILQSKYKGRVVVVNTGFEGLKLVKKGDFVIHLRSFQGGIEYAYDQGIISSAYTILYPTNAANSEYFKYLFKSSAFVDLLKTCVTGIREGQNINYSKLKQYQIPVPPIEEQKAIVKYIEDKTEKIKILMSELQSEIEYLKELKQRIVADAVTGQINVQNI